LKPGDEDNCSGESDKETHASASTKKDVIPTKQPTATEKPSTEKTNVATTTQNKVTEQSTTKVTISNAASTSEKAPTETKGKSH
jgi:hypothetical protein